MQNFFETSAKQASNPSPSTSNTTTGPDYTNYSANWQHDSQQHHHQHHQEGTTSTYQQEGGLSIWSSPQEGVTSYVDCYGGTIGATSGYLVESLPSCQKILTGDTAPLDWSTDATGTMTDIQYHDSASEESDTVSIKDIKTGYNCDQSCRFPFLSVSAHNSYVSGTELPLSERLQTFLIWANRWKIKEEYFPEGEDVDDDDADNNQVTPRSSWSRPKSSCLYKAERCTSKPNLYHLLTEATHNSNDNISLKELSPDAFVNCDLLGTALPASSTKCIRVPPDQILHPMKQSEYIETSGNHIHTVSELSDPAVNRSSLRKVSSTSGKADGSSKYVLSQKIPGDVTVGDSLRHAVRQAIGMLSSDQLHLLDEAIMFCAPTSRLK